MIPLTAVNLHSAPPLAGLAALAPPLLLAQASGQPAFWMLPFAAFVLVNLAVDLLYTAIDPRIRYGGEQAAG